MRIYMSIKYKETNKQNIFSVLVYLTINPCFVDVPINVLVTISLKP